MRFSYFLADQLIARGRKKPGYRDDALSEDWLGFTEKLLSEQGCLYAVSIEEMETAIELLLDGEGGEHVRRPRDLCCLEFDQAIRQATLGSQEPTRRLVEMNGKLVSEPVPDEE